MSSLEVQNLSKRFGRVHALNDISFAVPDGAFTVLLGPTAAGKTTTLRCVAGLEKLDNGTVKMDSQVVNDLSPAERDIAFVFQTYALYPRKTAYENIAFPLKARKLSSEEIDKRVKDIASLLQISELLDRRPAQMSGGQQQRVALGRAMVRQPRMFLMDEPLTNLDFKLRVEMRTELKRLQRELDTTFFYVTNDQVEAMSMADTIAVINKGVLQQVDSPETIYDRPANLFVAQFVGNPRINTLPCRYDAAQRCLIGEGGSWSLPLTAPQMDALSAATDTNRLIFGIRAEDVTLSVAPLAHESAMRGEIYVLEPLGDRTFVDIEMDGNNVIRSRADADFEAQPGQQVWFTFDLDRIHVFDAVTDKTLF